MKRRSGKGSFLGLVILALVVFGIIGNLTKNSQPDSKSGQDLSRTGLFTPSPYNQSQSGGPVAGMSTPDESSLDYAREALPTVTVQVQAQGPLQPDLPPDTGSYFYSPATFHSVNAFMPLYARLGGVASIGYPITEQFRERSTADGSVLWVQYFEKGEIEYHPELPAENRFQLTALGRERLNAKYPEGVSQPKPVSVPGKGTYRFPETGHTVGGLFLTQWHSGGEVSRYGYPLTESFQEKSDADGKTYIVQYFERAVMEYHPEKKAPYNVQLTALGSLKLERVYAQGAPERASEAQPSPTPNYGATQVAKDARATAVAQVRVTSEARVSATAEARAQRASRATGTAEALAPARTETAISKKYDATMTAIARAYPTSPGVFIPYPGNGGGPTTCSDGSISHSSGRGTCSHHGGIRK